MFVALTKTHRGLEGGHSLLTSTDHIIAQLMLKTPFTARIYVRLVHRANALTTAEQL